MYVWIGQAFAVWGRSMKMHSRHGGQVDSIRMLEVHPSSSVTLFAQIDSTLE